MDIEVAVEQAMKGSAPAREAAQFLGIGRTKLFEMAHARELVWVRIGKQMKFPRAALVMYLAGKIKENNL